MPYKDIYKYKEYQRQYRINNKKKLKEKYRETHRINQKRSYLKNPIKHRARSILAYAIKTGKIKRLPCELCGNMVSHGHHSDYSKPFEVIWLCVLHHLEAHGGKFSSK